MGLGEKKDLISLSKMRNGPDILRSHQETDGHSCWVTEVKLNESLEP